VQEKRRQAWQMDCPPRRRRWARPLRGVICQGDGHACDCHRRRRREGRPVQETRRRGLYRLYYEQRHCAAEVMALTIYGAHDVIVTTATRQEVRECTGLPTAGRHAGRDGLAEGPYCHSERAAVDARIEEASGCRLGRGHVEGCRGGIELYYVRPCSCKLKPLDF